MKRRLHAALLGVLALILGGGALVLTSAGTAGADDSSGTVTLTPTSGSLSDNPPLTGLTLSNGCPAGFQDSITINVVIPNTGESSIVYNLTDGAPFTASPLTVSIPASPGPTTYINSMADAFSNYNATVADGTYPVEVVCSAADQSHTGESTFTTLIDITGDTWAVKQAPAPTSTSVALAVSPVGSITVGHDVTLTATVTPSDAVGSIQFVGGANSPVGGAQPVSGGTATTTFKASAARGIYSYQAVFTPTDPTAFAASQSAVLAYPVLDEPAITVLDDTGNNVSDDPTLTTGQKIKVTALGFMPGPDPTAMTGGETVTVTLDGAAGDLAKASANGVGTVANYQFTVPSSLSSGDHTLKLKGETTGVELSFPFKVGTGGSGDTSGSTAGDTSGSTAGDTSGSTAGDTSGSTAGDTSGSTAGDTSGSTAGDTSGTSGTSGDVSGGTSGTSGDTSTGGTSGGGNGPLAATGAAGITTISVLALMLLCGGGYAVYRVRRDGRLLSFGPTPRD